MRPRVPPWRSLGATALRICAVWLVTTVTMLILSGLLPDFRLQSADGDSATRVGITAAIGAGVFGLLGALVWPILVRALLLVPALVLGLLVFFLNGSLLWLALNLAPYGEGSAEPTTAVVVAAVMSAASSATSTFLAVRDDDAYRRRLSRLADRDRRRAPEGARPRTPGTVFIQLDGVGHEVLREAVAEGPDGRPTMPTVAEMYRETHRLTRWRTDWSSQTGASQLGILHGSNHDVPAFRWYEKERGEAMVSNRPSSAAKLQRRAVEATGDRGLLALDGASRGNLFSGGAGQVALVLSVSARRGKEQRSRDGYFAYFSDPANATRTAVSFVAEVFREILQSVRARARRKRPRVSRGGLYPLIRAFATVVQRDVVVAAVLGDLLSGRTAVYADLVAYDEVAHHSGPRDQDSLKVLRRLDRSVALIAKAARRAPRPYRIVLLSDHGQSPGETFEGAFGLTLEDLVRAGCGLPVSRRARRTDSGAEARTAARAALGRPEESEPGEPTEPTELPEAHAPLSETHTSRAKTPRTGCPDDGRAREFATPADPGASRAPEAEPDSEQRAEPVEPVVLCSGNLGLVSFPDVPGRAFRERIEERHPALLRVLSDHRGIGFLLVHSEWHGPVVLGPGGGEHWLDTGEIVGPDPMAPFGPGAVDAVRRTAAFPHAADIMVNSAVDPGTGEVHAFEEQIGSHGGLGGEQSQAFLLAPLELSPPEADGGGELVGAERVHSVLRRWLAEADSEPAVWSAALSEPPGEPERVPRAGSGRGEGREPARGAGAVTPLTGPSAPADSGADPRAEVHG